MHYKRQQQEEGTFPDLDSAESFYSIGFDENGEIESMTVSEQVGQLVGMSPESIVRARSWQSRILERHHSSFYTHRETLLAGQVGLTAYLVEHDSGDQRWLVDTAQPVFDEACGSVREIRGVLIDLDRTPGMLNLLERLHRESQ